MKFLPLAQSLAIAALFSTSALADDVADAAAKGKAKFVLCGACHGLTGNGQPAPGMQMAASFLDSKILKMDAELSALVLFKGLKKENPAEFMGQIMMPLGATMPDEDVANIITYIRSEFGGVKEVTTAEQVAAWRAKHADSPQPTRADLEKMAAKE
ncbi:MAG: cytochrome c [Verrucomicrobiales bacterium]|nr:cytochrome c [Verrucomicrobiales bacterium]